MVLTGWAVLGPEAEWDRSSPSWKRRASDKRACEEEAGKFAQSMSELLLPAQRTFSDLTWYLIQSPRPEEP